MNTGTIDYSKKYINKNKLIERLLIKLGIIQFEDRYIYIDLRPDYDITPNQRDFAPYFFKNKWNFSGVYEYVFNIEIHKKRIYTDIDIEEISKELKMAKFQFDGSYCDFLLKISKENPAELECYGFPTDLDQFVLQSLRISNIDNLTKNVNYEGSFLGDCYEIESDTIPLYAYSTVKSLPLVIDKFYKNLIAEAYLLFLQNNYKLSFFILFTAFESFVNFESSPRNKKGQVNQKLVKLFDEKFGSSATHEIFAHFKDYFSKANNIRNAIAHGKEYIEISFENIEDLFKYSLSLITSFQFLKRDFKNLLDWVSKQNF